MFFLITIINIDRYGVIALTQRNGIMEFVPSTPLSSFAVGTGAVPRDKIKTYLAGKNPPHGTTASDNDTGMSDAALKRYVRVSV